MYKVYAKLDLNKCITDIESSAFYSEERLLNDGYTFIDEGEDGSIYGHAQPNYLQIKYGKPMFDETGRPNFKYVNSKVVALTSDEKKRLFPESKPEPTETDKEIADLYFQVALLQAQGVSVSTMSLSAISPRYELIKKYYDMGLYNESNLEVFVEIGWITEDEKLMIIG